MKIIDDYIPLLQLEIAEALKEDSSSGSVTGGTGQLVSQNNLGKVVPTTLIKKRQKLIKPYNDQKKSSAAKEGWRSARYNHLKGIKAFAKSVEGKRFHRNLGNFIANKKPKEKMNRFESAEFISLLSSYRTHALIDLQYYKPLNEEVTFLNAIEEFVDFIDSYTKKILETVYSYDDYEITEDLFDSVVRILETASVVKSLSDRSGKSEAEVEKAWEAAKETVKKEYNKTENDENFYA